MMTWNTHAQGKTTTILSVLKQLPKDYKVVLLKNEYGDVEGSYTSPAPLRLPTSHLASRSPQSTPY